MPSLFEPFTAGDLQLANRVVMAPLTRNRSPKGVPTQLAVDYYSQRASAGLIISEATAVSHQGQGYADVPGLYAPEQLKAWRRTTDAVANTWLARQPRDRASALFEWTLRAAGVVALAGALIGAAGPYRPEAKVEVFCDFT